MTIWASVCSTKRGVELRSRCIFYGTPALFEGQHGAMDGHALGQGKSTDYQLGNGRSTDDFAC